MEEVDRFWNLLTRMHPILTRIPVIKRALKNAYIIGRLSATLEAIDKYLEN